MIISKSRNFVYVHLEKCGGTSIEVALEPYLSWDDMILGSTTFGTMIQMAYAQRYGWFQYKDIALWKHSTAHEIKKHIPDQWDNMYKFATVRNPKHLIESLYYYSQKTVDTYLKEKQIESVKEIVNTEKMPQNWISDDTFLGDYCQAVAEESNINGFIYRVITKERPVVIPQTDRLTEDIELFDLYDMKKSWPIILNKVGIEHNIDLPRLNKSNRPDKNELTKNSMKLIKDHFKKDYETIPKLTKVNWE